MIKQKRVKITRKHIQKGIKGDAESCPIACALLARKGVDYVEVDGEVLTIEDDKGNGRVYEMPARASNFVTKFDDGKDVHPFSFKLGKVVDQWDEDGDSY